MYCRSCGEPISEKAIKCLECNTVNGEGVDYCPYCGGYTTELTEFCRKCGAKLKTILPQRVKIERYNEIVKQIKSCKKIQGILKFFIIGSVVATVLFAMILVLREEPSNIPDPFYTYTLEFGEDKIYQPSDYMNYADDNVQEYWAQGRQLISYIIMSFIVFVGTFIDLLIQKSKYKKLLKALKEAKNVL